ncbi:hypothetical protein PV963_18940 [Streptomyces coeruleorubidus]|uniref:hypothetical protein n=1 Tax=Streptomyces coeruleorubidus TaxID=116188 RepID=UPI00237FD39D|nr:hypothetical protein [Streptomyces coeruleorubidus]WDV52301.1 hypothetical protein PV963_18940 [Streptomyces coeruleorubidus]
MDELVAAVRRGDEDEVRALLESGADPETLTRACRSCAGRWRRTTGRSPRR